MKLLTSGRKFFQLPENMPFAIIPKTGDGPARGVGVTESEAWENSGLIMSLVSPFGCCSVMPTPRRKTERNRMVSTQAGCEPLSKHRGRIRAGSGSNFR